ncbi:hypothetical protein PZB74_14680 [Porifericola rhodea]|uniref:hypothetical protein n=1 Tax=Porifericola rhodea TaxID=930972 RepID=UPI0026669E30|nr:hypothetical protein [Porifericola rhodea]WKN30209.1 hypothetical protein PZB74_14680 [Porifericola rhodea]
MKKTVMHYFDLDKPAPAKALPVSAHNNSDVSITELCSIDEKTGSLLDDVELSSALEQLQLNTPIFFLLASIVFSWLAFYAQLSVAPSYMRRIKSITPPIPLFIRHKRLVLYA